MRYLLAERNRRHLLALANGRTLLGFDFDGTLAPIVTDRDAARMRPRTARLFRELCAMFPCAVISGRSRDDVARRLGSVPVRYVVGDHGADAGTARAEYHDQMVDVVEDLRQALVGLPGVEIENKVASVAVHYRRAPDAGAARERIEAALVSSAPRVRLIPGKFVVNVVPRLAPHKGDAFRQLVRSEGAEQALYVGDDDTDEDVFRLELADRPVTVRVGASPRSRAEYFLHDQAEIDDLLRVLARGRPTRPAGGQAVPGGRTR
jgi:trehalose 6-phosphate phosphatase